MNAISRYDAASKALMEAKTLDEVKNIADKAVAIQEYARRAKNKTLEIDAAELRMRAERKLGEILEPMPKAKGTRGQLAGPGPGRGKTGSTKIEPLVST